MATSLASAVERIVERFTPVYDLYMLQSGPLDLLYCTLSFAGKNMRWPTNHAELSAFVRQSDGYLMLGEYERVSFTPLPDHRLELRYVRPGHTNEMKLTFGNSSANK
jgi:hypothetical protein